MKSIYFDLRRALAGRWFLAALLASVAALYMSMGDLSYMLACQLEQLCAFGEAVDLTAAELLQSGFQGDFGVMTLPALSALPFAAQALQEIKSGVIRPVVFRVGRTSWMCGKLLATLFSGMLVHLAAALALTGILQGLMLVLAGGLFPMGKWNAIWPLLLRRMLCGGIWACVGCLVALVTETASAAYLAPLCLCYAMVMLATRFFPETPLLNPVNWYTGAVWPLLIVLVLLACALGWTLRRKVNAYV